ncbi:Zinc finger BED domain-containing protein RICESLEEPER 2 [Linum perenne]
MNRIIYLAAALDPRQKLKHVQKCLSKVYGLRRAIEIVGEVKDLFAELFESYKTMLLPPRAPRTSVSQSSATSSQNNRRPSINTDIRRLSTRGRCTAIHDSDDEEDMVDSSELTLYFTEAQYREKDQEDNSVVDSFDILKWWATHGVRFPVLAEIARDMLAIPISTVASESAFSTGGRVLNSFRTSLIPGIVEALICCGDWLRMSSIHSVSMNDEEDVPVEDLETEYEEDRRMNHVDYISAAACRWRSNHFDQTISSLENFVTRSRIVEGNRCRSSSWPLLGERSDLRQKSTRRCRCRRQPARMRENPTEVPMRSNGASSVYGSRPSVLRVTVTTTGDTDLSLSSSEERSSDLD